MSQSARSSETIPTVEAAIGYLVDTGEMPVFYQSNVAGERTSFEGEREQRSMVIRDARALPNTFSLDGRFDRRLVTTLVAGLMVISL